MSWTRFAASSQQPSSWMKADAQLTTPSITPAEVESPEYEIWKRRYTTVQRQPGLYSVLIPVFLGNLRTKDAIALADFLEGFGTDVVRATFGQNLRLRNIPEAYLGNVYQLVSAFSELSSAPALLANSIACTGADTCKLGICLSKGALAAIARKLAQSGLNLDDLADFKINLSGCPNTCGQHMLADLGFYGQVARKDQLMYPAYGVVAGAVIGDGKARLATHIDRISSRDLPDFVVDLLKIYLEKKVRYGSFDEYVAGEGAQDIRTLCDRYREIPEFEDDKSYYQDWGAEAAFSLIGKGLGECSAGLFDLIEVDLKQIQSLEKKLCRRLVWRRERERALSTCAFLGSNVAGDARHRSAFRHGDLRQLQHALYQSWLGRRALSERNQRCTIQRPRCAPCRSG